VRDAKAIERAFADVALRYGHIDVLFNNAGINRPPSVLELTLDDWNAVVAVNMTGMFICARAAVRHMVPGGRIVNTASMLGLSGGWYPNIAYQGDKGAVVNMTRSWAIEWAPPPDPGQCRGFPALCGRRSSPRSPINQVSSPSSSN